MFKTMKTLILAAMIVPSVAFAATWTPNFKGADVTTVIDQVAEATGKTFILDPRVKGKVDVEAKVPLDEDGMYSLLLSVLSVHGFGAIETRDGVKIVPVNIVKQAGIDFADGKKIDNSQIITKVIGIKNANANDLVPVIRPLIPQYGHLMAVDSLNALIISDHANNIAELQTLIRKLDNTRKTSVEVISLENAWSSDVIGLLQELNGGAGQGKGGTAGFDSLRVIADERTNRIIVKGDKDAVLDAKAMIRSLDIPTRKTNRINVVPLHYANAEKMAQLLTSLTPSGEGAGKQMSIAADTDQNNLVIMATPSELVDLRAVINELDVPRAQVLVEAIIVEVSMGNSDAMGFQWLFSDVTGGTTPAMGTNFDVAGNSVNQIAQGIASGVPALANGMTAGLLGGSTIGNINFAGILQLIEENSDANLLSTPKLLTLDNHKAEILVGETRPFQTGAYAESSSNAFVTTTREDIGLSLQVTPHINANDEVTMEVLQKVESASTQPSSLGTITSKRQIETTVIAANGSTVVLGGLMQDNVTTQEQKVPVLGDIPMVGGLFRSTSTSVDKKNLMIFIRPTILHSQQELSELSKSKFNAFKSIQISEDLFIGRAQTADDLLDAVN